MDYTVCVLLYFSERDEDPAEHAYLSEHEAYTLVFWLQW